MRTGAAAPIRERAFHEWLARHLPAGRSGALPLGDDAAALPSRRGRIAVLTTDSLIEGTHFLRDSPPERIGAAAVAVSLSDLAAKGARPAAVLLAIIVPPGTRAGWVRSLVRGAERMARAHGATVVGGDTKPGPTRTIVSAALGWGTAGQLAPRTGARVGDVLVTTGTVGRGGLAAARLARAPRPGLAVLASLLDVRPRVREGRALALWAHAMLDTSDGLAESARLLADASGIRVVVEERLLPLARGVRSPSRSRAERWAIAFYGGDYELLAALPPARYPSAARAVRRVGGSLQRIGRLERGSGAWLDAPDGRVPMPRTGWRPFERARSR